MFAKFKSYVNHSPYPIHDAVKGGCREDVQEALAKNALPNRNTGIRPIDEQDKDYQRTPLHYAADARYNDSVKLAVVKVLLNNKARRCIQDFDGSTPLHLAARAGSLPVVIELLTGGDPNELADLLRRYDRGQNNALMLAAEQGHAQMVTALLGYMTPDDTRFINVDQNNALMMAAAAGHRDVVLTLLQKMTPNDLQHVNGAGMTALLIASERGNKDIVEALARGGARLDARVGSSGASALHLAARNGDISTVRWLSENNPGLVATPDNDRRIPYEWAMDAGRVGVANLLREYKSPSQQQPGASFTDPSSQQRLSAGGDRISAGGAYPTLPYNHMGGQLAGQMAGQAGGPYSRPSLSAPLFGPGAVPSFSGGGTPGPAEPGGAGSPLYGQGAVPMYGQGGAVPPSQPMSPPASQSSLWPVAEPRPSTLYSLPPDAAAYH